MSRQGSNHHQQLLNLPYFHTSFRSSNDVKVFLASHLSRPGSFILRPSFSKPNCVTVSVVLVSREIRHLNIYYDGMYYLVEDNKFNNIPALIEFYADNPVYNRECVSDVKFLHPVKKSRLQRRVTEPTIQGGYDLSPASTQSIGSGGASGGSRNRSGSNFTGVPDRNRNGSTRSEGGEGGTSASGGKTKRFPGDRLPTLPASRPPAPLPNDPQTDKKPEYSYPSDDQDKSGDLIKTLREIEICDCGLPVKESQLPEGWSVHQTAVTQEAPRKRLFYQSPNMETFWVPPPELALQFTEEHRKNIQKLTELYIEESGGSGER